MSVGAYLHDIVHVGVHIDDLDLARCWGQREPGPLVRRRRTATFALIRGPPFLARTAREGRGGELTEVRGSVLK